MNMRDVHGDVNWIALCHDIITRQRRITSIETGRRRKRTKRWQSFRWNNDLNKNLIWTSSTAPRDITHLYTKGETEEERERERSSPLWIITTFISWNYMIRTSQISHLFKSHAICQANIKYLLKSIDDAHIKFHTWFSPYTLPSRYFRWLLPEEEETSTRDYYYSKRYIIKRYIIRESSRKFSGERERGDRERETSRGWPSRTHVRSWNSFRHVVSIRASSFLFQNEPYAA